MANDFTNFGAQVSLGANNVPPSPGCVQNEALGRPAPGRNNSGAAACRAAGFAPSETIEFLPSPAEESASQAAQLRDAAEAEARSWKAPGKKQGHGLLKKKWSESSSSIGTVLRPSGRLPVESDAANRPVTELRNNARLIEAALTGTRDLHRTALQLPEVETGRRQVIARAYAAVGAYLHATEFQFQENSFVTFFLAIQETCPLRLRELWALKALTQLVLLERIGRAARGVTNGNKKLGDTPHDTLEPALGIPLCVAGLRAIDIAPWKEICEEIGAVNRILRDDPCGAYPRMDSESRDQYLQAVNQLGRFSETEEPEIALRAIALARSVQKQRNTNSRFAERRSHVGFYLVGEGRPLLERQIHYRPPIPERLRNAMLAWPEIYYFVGIELLTFAIIAFLLVGARAPVSLIAALILLSLPVTEAAWGVMNQLTVSFLTPQALPKLDFSEGVPGDYATLAVVPTLLLSEAYIRRMVADLEIRFLGNRDAHLYFALLTDAPDSPHPSDQSDGLVSLCSKLIEELNAKYSSPGTSTFFLFHRSRTFNPSEGAWMGWERKRGKLLDLNDLLRGERDSFPVKVGDLSVLPHIKYVIVVDSDTQLPRGVARQLVATMAHPLNRAVINPTTNTVVEGYGIVQPRVGISVQSASRSLLASLYSGQTGFDSYTHAVSDIYQDLFGEGTFAGKGIYEVDVFRKVLGKRFPCNAILSHDLIEGTYTRAGLVSDVEVVDDYPTHFSAYSRRKHRWVRGDWQIMSWLLPRVPDAEGKRVPNPLSLLSRWKIFDNLRRSLVEVATFVLLLAGWLSLPGSPRRWTLVVVVLMLIPTYLQFTLSLLKIWPLHNFLERMKESTESFIAGQINVFFQLAFLSHQTLVMLDAIIRTLVRVTITRRKLLEWETAAQAEVEARKTPVDVYLAWTPWLSLTIGAVLAVCRPVALPDAAPLLVLWACAGPLAHWLNRPLHPGKASLSQQEEQFLRGVSLRTWRFFRQYASEADHGLAPDNIQEIPLQVDHRISPTNLGLLLNSQLAAYELGYLTLPEFVSQVERTLESARRLHRFRGHFLNWYNTQTLEPAGPPFVSSVDSGNLVCSLWTLKQGCLKALQDPLLRRSTWEGLRDHINLLDELASQVAPASRAARAVGRISAQIELLPDSGTAWVCALPGFTQDLRNTLLRLVDKSEAVDELRWWTGETIQRAEAVQDMLDQLLPWMSPHDRSMLNQISSKTLEQSSALNLHSLGTASADLDAVLEKTTESPTADSLLRFAAKDLQRRLPGSLAEADRLLARLARLAEEAEQLVQEMDFRFLYNSSRKLLSVGYDVERQSANQSCYDLLASEARSATFAAIAKGDISQETWLYLNRPQGRWRGESVLLSWSGTMFEYLMPALWFEHRPRTLLGESVRSAVHYQIEWAGKSLPWGVSEAAYSARDASGHYQYQAFGVPFLSLSPDPHEDVVISPYSTCLALAVDPRAAVLNLERMRDMNWLGELGFYDSADFSPSRVTPQEGYKVVRCWMAHHQGMSLLAACNLLTGDAIRKLFHAEPAIRATELLLHEKPVPTAQCIKHASGAGSCAKLLSRGDSHDPRA